VSRTVKNRSLQWRTIAILVFLCFKGFHAPSTLKGQLCPEGPISSISITSKPVFDVGHGSDKEADPPSKLYRFGNWLHAETDETFLRKQLLFSEGDCHSQFLLAESERRLRELDFLASADVRSYNETDGSKGVLIETQDRWTLQISLGTSLEEGFEFTGGSIAEENLFGQGLAVRGFYRKLREKKDTGVGIESKRLLGSNWGTKIEGGETRIGTFFEQDLSYPFLAEIGRVSSKQSILLREDVFAYYLPDNQGYSHALQPLRQRSGEISFAGRSGQPGGWTLFGIGISRQELSFDNFSTGTEVIRDRDFSTFEKAPEPITQSLKHQIQDQRVTRVNLLLGQRNIQYIKRNGLNGLKGSLDIPVGREFDLTVGKGVSFLSTNDMQNEKDLFFSLRGYGAIAPGGWILTSSFALQGRKIADSPQSGWHDLLGEFDFYASWKPEVTPRHTLFARISGSGGWKTTTPFQLSLGGFSTLRGYRLGYTPGAKLLVATIEDRIYLGSPGDGLMDIGMTGFVDLGSMWAGDVPFGSDSGLQASAGAGIRIGLPSGSKDVVRIDVAVPINGPTAFSGPTFRITAYEMLGFLRGFEDDEMRRSRRVGGGLKLISSSSSSF
tara:strand:- start:52364 stop:54193 length:1830 start_codon:yes stop_codon:yes gene_type:complete